mgnify:CR=1 FL=1
MAEQVRVVVDAMGGDNAPAEPVKAAVEAVTERQDIKVILTGKQDVIEGELAKILRISHRTNPDCSCLRGDRDSRTACICNP